MIVHLGRFLGRKGDGEPRMPHIGRGWEALDLLTNFGGSMEDSEEKNVGHSQSFNYGEIQAITSPWILTTLNVRATEETSRP